MEAKHKRGAEQPEVLVYIAFVTRFIQLSRVIVRTNVHNNFSSFHNDGSSVGFKQTFEKARYYPFFSVFFLYFSSPYLKVIIFGSRGPLSCYR